MDYILRHIGWVVRCITLQVIIDLYGKRLHQARVKKEHYIDKIGVPLQGSSIEHFMDNFQSLKDAGDANYTKVMLYRTKEQSLLKKYYWWRISQQLYLLGLTILAACIYSMVFPGLGLNIKVEYYAALSQIYPIILITLYISSPKQPSTESITYLEMARLRNIDRKLIGTLSAMIGAGASLATLATGVSSTSLFILSLATIALMIYSIFNNIKED